MQHRNIVQTEFKPRWREGGGGWGVGNWLTLVLPLIISKLVLKIVSSVGIVSIVSILSIIGVVSIACIMLVIV